MNSSEPAVFTDYKFVVALKAKLDSGVALNAASHLALGLVAQAARSGDDQLAHMSFLDFADSDGGSHSPLSGLSLAVLQGRPAWLRRLRNDFIAADVCFTDFTSDMTGDTYREQLDRMAQTPEEELDYYGVAAFGKKEIIDPLTKKFSLWR
ncbi:DUF2000 domain-containing protein [Nocardiopsis gilva YIM 90087]|uniref:DUF2000 domain-containing protein n=1 Tax=Nocardiopsis gilva YIM 90087 TaxID=1235441 RepID=A0A223SA86_9ACTN|nr:DUF2000 domain-containing protein [Nocardiopsis gilva]ASU85040.1 DUF2000 domain-containing protein [Nocardiopsis gilva YIM 90087]